MKLVFEWNQAKASSNLRKHGVSFLEASPVFRDPLAAIISDPDHSDGERREIMIGLSAEQRLLFVSFKEVHENRIRILSARCATKGERQDDEEND